MELSFRHDRNARPGRTDAEFQTVFGAKTGPDILLIEARASIRTAFEGLVSDAYGQAARLRCVAGVAQATEAIAKVRFDVVFVGTDETATDVVDLVRTVAAANARIPLIVVATEEPYPPRMETFWAGASDVMRLNELSGPTLGYAIEHAMSRKEIVEHLREGRDVLTRYMLDLREERERFELESATYAATAADLATAKAETEEAVSQAKKSENRCQLLFESSPAGIWHLSADGETLFMNAAARKLFEIGSDGETRLTAFEAFFVEEDRPTLRAARIRWLKGERLDIDVRILGIRSGAIKDVIVSAVSCPTDDGKAGILATATDVTEQRRAAVTIEHLAHHDPLTGLPNRMLFQDRLNHAVTIARRSGERVALLFLDLDGFKDINDTMGHAVGDILLADVAQRLLDCVRDSDTVARLGGDEFAVICPNLRHEEDIRHLASRIIRSLRTPFDIDDTQVRSGTSIGIAMFPADTKLADQLVRFADMALFDAKEKGRGRFSFFNREIDRAVRKRKSIENALHDALKNEDFVLHYQPQVCMDTGNLVGVEALIRWNHAKKGLVPPNDFIPVAESTGLIIPIGNWAARTACEQAKRWSENGALPINVAINLSAIQFRNRNLVTDIESILTETGIDPHTVEFELTESTVMEDVDLTVRAMWDLADLGVTLAIDDFGTGFSSLAYLKKFPVHRLKIDRSFVTDILDDPDSLTIARSIIGLGHSLKMTVLAEGVETEAQARALMAEGCRYAQGYLFGKPIPASEFPAWLGTGAAPDSGRFDKRTMVRWISGPANGRRAILVVVI